MGMNVLIVHQNILFASVNIQQSLMVKKLKSNAIAVRLVKKTFTDLTNTVLYRTRHLNQWIKFIECKIEGYSLRKSANLIGNITHVTLFYWRHKLLSSLKQMEIPNFEGVVEMDETYFLYS